MSNNIVQGFGQQITIRKSQDNKVFLDSFLMDSSPARNGMKVDSGFLARHIQKFVGKPVIPTPHKNHSKEFMRYKQTGSPAIDVAELMKMQEKHRISRIVSVHPTNV